MSKWWQSFNDWIAIKANQIFATMNFFWFCLVIVLIPLKWPILMPFLQYLSSGILQLIALPLLGVGTILAARSSDRLAKEMHDATMESHEEIKKLIAEDDDIEHKLDSILAILVPQTSIPTNSGSQPLPKDEEEWLEAAAKLSYETRTAQQFPNFTKEHGALISPRIGSVCIWEQLTEEMRNQEKTTVMVIVKFREQFDKQEKTHAT